MTGSPVSLACFSIKRSNSDKSLWEGTDGEVVRNNNVAQANYCWIRRGESLFIAEYYYVHRANLVSYYHLPPEHDSAASTSRGWPQTMKEKRVIFPWKNEKRLNKNVPWADRICRTSGRPRTATNWSNRTRRNILQDIACQMHVLVEKVCVCVGREVRCCLSKFEW